MDSPPDPMISNGPFTLSEAEAAGITRDRLRGSRFVGVSHGLYRPASWDFELREAARALCAATPGAWISHTTAARLHELILPPWLSDSTDLHLSKPRRLPETRRKGIVGHTLLVFPSEVATVDGLPISTRARTWLDMARLLPLAELVCLGDQLIRIPRPAFEQRDKPFSTPDEMRTMMGKHKNLQGIVRARAAMDLMRIGADSAQESLMRLAMLDAGLPEPDLQITLWGRDAGPSADAGYRARRIAIQYDGAHHLDELQRHSDNRRDHAFRDAGWTVLVFTQEDLADGFAGAVRQIKAALHKSWEDPTIASGFVSGA